MGRADDKGAEALLSEAEEEKDKDNNVSKVDEEKNGVKRNLEGEDSDISRKKYQCTHPGCDARFLRPSRLTWHLRKHNDERPYKCDREGCDKAYTNSSHLKRHLLSSHKEPITKTYECKECGVEVGSLFSLKRHNKKIHDPDRLTCHECGAKFRKKHCYNEHVSMHAGVAMYKCDICNQNFTQLRLLKKHQRIHDPRNYTCTSPGCNEFFEKWSQLRKHLAVAHEFDHSCDKCEKMFKRKYNLKKHQAVHDNNGLIEACPYGNCPRYYSYEKNLDKHIRTVHLNQRYKCDACGKSFKFRRSIITHIQTFHEEQKPKKPANSGRKKPRLRRKDAGDPTTSMVSKLAGVELPFELEKRVLRRSTRIRLKNPDNANQLEFEKSPTKIIETISCVLNEVVNSEKLNTQSKLVKDPSEKPKKVEKADNPSVLCDEERNSIPAAVAEENIDGIRETSSLPSSTPMIVEEKSEEELLSELLESLENDNSTKTPRKDLGSSGKENEEEISMPSFPNETLTIGDYERSTAAEQDEAQLLSALLNDLETNVPLMSLVANEKPIVLV